MPNNFTTRTASLRATTASVHKLDTKEVSINGENIDSKYASLNASNTFQSNNIFNGSISVSNTADFATTIRKGGTSEDNEILNCAESDARYAQLEAENTFTANNTFEQEVQLENGATANNNINLRSGDLLIHENGNLTFFDDGVVTTGEESSGSLYTNCYTLVPSKLNHNRVYDFGLVEEERDLSTMEFSNSTILVQTCEIWFKTGDTVYDIIWPENIYWIDSSTGAPPEFNTNMKYRIALRNEFDTIVASLSYSYPNLG